jgi:sulfatase maturation enzyme AslB (radical SAM superfamily)
MRRFFNTNPESPAYSRASRVIQIHPSLQCNLSCRHCYSNSSPAFKDGLDVYRLQHITEQLARFGYNVISLSGGEPFLYRPLEELLTHTHKLGYFNSITTNAMLLGSERAKKVLKQANLIAISIDGKPPQHDHIRNFDGAFQKMLAGVNIVKDHVDSFGFIHTLFPGSLETMPWLTHFAMRNGAKLMHFHPLEIAGRAIDTMQSVSFDSVILHKIYILFHYLKELYKEDIFMQLDLLHRDHIIGNPNFVFHQADTPAFTAENFSNVFKELIIDEQGDMIPIAHGCSKHFRIGNIYDDIPCSEMIENFMEEKMDDIVGLYKTTYDAIVKNEFQELFNWSELVIRFSREMFDLRSMSLSMKM